MIRVSPTDRLFAAGMTRTGKSTLVSAIANRWDRVLVYDPNVDPVAELPNATIAYGHRAALAALPGRVIYRPTPAESGDPGSFFGALCARVFELGSIGVVVHEAADFGATDRETDPRIIHLIRAGRHRFVPIASVTQRPVNVARAWKSEASHLVCFFLTDPDDRRTMAGYMGPEVAANPVPPDFSAWYRSPDLELRRLPPIKL